MSRRSTEHPALVSAVRHGLGQPEQPVRLEASDAPTVLDRARFDHITGFLAVAARDGIVRIDDAQTADDLERRWREELRTCVMLEAVAVRAADILCGLEWRLVKGAALAHLDYPDPSTRTFGDVDLLIHPGDWPTAIERLAASGYRRNSVVLPGSYDVRWGKGATLTGLDGLELDVHRRFAVGRFGVSAHMEDIFASADHLVLADRSIPTLVPEDRLIHACYHASLGGFRRLRAFRDVAQLLLVSDVDWRTTFSLARSWRAEAVVASAVAETWRRLELRVAHPAHERSLATAISNGDRRALRHFTERSTFRRQALTAVPRLPVREAPRYVWSLARHRLPSWRRR